jgi:hypothetical protein
MNKFINVSRGCKEEMCHTHVVIFHKKWELINYETGNKEHCSLTSLQHLTQPKIIII